MRKPILSVISLFALLLLFSACGNHIQLTIKDERYTTQITVKPGKSVEEILKEAEITLREKDTVTPELASVPASGEEIRIDRYAQTSIRTDNGTKTVALNGATVADALKEAGISLEENEHLNVYPSVFLSELKEDIVISRLYTVILIHDGKNEKLYTAAKTVEELLKEADVSLDGDDRISPAPATPLRVELEITLQRVTKKTQSVEEAIPFETKKEYDDTLDAGVTRVKQEGVEGKRAAVYEIVFVDGTEESRDLIEENVISAPAAEILIVGTYRAPEPPTEPEDPSKIIVSKVAVYDCDGSGHGYYVITFADGHEEYEEF